MSKQKKNKKIPFFRKILVFINIVFAAGLLVIYLSSLVNPANMWLAGIPGLFYPLLLLINILFILYWVIRRKYYLWLSLVSIVIGWSFFQGFFQLKTGTLAPPESGTHLKVLSYNVRVFDLYNYDPNWKLNFEQRDNIINFLRQEDFDIIGLQEFVHDSSGKFKTLDTIPDVIYARYHHTGFTESSGNTNYFGLAIFSSYPIVHKGEIKFDTKMGNHCIYADILIDRDTVRVYNVHFESIGLSPEDYLFMENITNIENLTTTEYLKTSGKRILKRLRAGYSMRGTQAQIVTSHIKESPFPVVVTGDFNDTPASYVYRQFNKTLTDSFRSGKGIGQTYRGSIPGFRIDYIWHSEHFKSYNYTTGDQKYSDHFPVYTWLNLNKNLN